MMARRLALAQATGCTVMTSTYGVNDISAGDSLATLQSSMNTIWTAFDAVGIKPVHWTITPRTTSTDAWATVANQTLATNGGNSAFGAGGVGVPASIRAQLNTWIRSKPAPLWDFIEAADAAEGGRETGTWALDVIDGTSRGTTDGLHPSVIATTGQTANTASVIGAGRGAVFRIRDVIIPRINAWQS